MKECKKHDKVYSQYGIETNNGTTTEWICRKCGERGSDFSPASNNEYNELCQKFNKE